MKPAAALLALILSFALAFPASAALVIDAGHGGEDGGAVSIHGQKESLINLNIALKMDAIAGLYGISPVLTRSSEELSYPESALTVKARKQEEQKARVALINSVKDAFLISIHQNKYGSASPFGAQVFYSANGGSAAAAQLLQSLFISQIDPDNRRSAVQIDSSIYLFKKINCPGILVECGFLSNPREEKLLCSEAYQLKLAAVIMAGYLQFIALEAQNES